MVERTSQKPIYLAMEDANVASSIIQMIRRYPNLETLRVAKPPGKLAVFMVEREPSIVVVDSEVAPTLVIKAKSRLPHLSVIVVAPRDEVLRQPVNTALSTRLISSDCNQKELHALLDTLLDDSRQDAPVSPVADVIALLSIGAHHGSLEVRNNDTNEQGTIGFSNGNLATSELGSLDGFKAINKMKEWPSCSFRWTHLIEGLDDDFLEDVSSPVGNVSDFLHYEPGLVETTDTSMFPMAFADDEPEEKQQESFIPSGLADPAPAKRRPVAKPAIPSREKAKEQPHKSAPAEDDAKKKTNIHSPKKDGEKLDSSTETFTSSTASIPRRQESSSASVNPSSPRDGAYTAGESNVVSSTNASGKNSNPEHTIPTTGAQMASNATEILQELTGISGFIAGAVVDSDSGMTLAKISNSMSFDIDVAAATNTEVIKAKLRAAKALKLEDGIEDILITLTHQYHLLRPLEEYPSIFFYLALDREQANLAMARIKLKTVGAKIKL